MHSQQPPGVVQNWSTLQCSKQNTEQCGYDHAPVTRGRMRAQYPLPHGLVAPGIPHPAPDAFQRGETELRGFTAVAGVDPSRVPDGTTLQLIFVSEEHGGSGGSRGQVHAPRVDPQRLKHAVHRPPLRRRARLLSPVSPGPFVNT